MISDEHLEWLSKMLLEASNSGFSGNIQINFFKGAVTNINKHESFKLPVLTQ